MTLPPHAPNEQVRCQCLELPLPAWGGKHSREEERRIAELPAPFGTS